MAWAALGAHVFTAQSLAVAFRNWLVLRKYLWADVLAEGLGRFDIARLGSTLKRLPQLHVFPLASKQFTLECVQIGLSQGTPNPKKVPTLKPLPSGESTRASTLNDCQEEEQLRQLSEAEWALQNKGNISVSKMVEPLLKESQEFEATNN